SNYSHAARLAPRQPRTAQAPKFSINELHLSSDSEKPGEFLRGSASYEVARLPQIKQQILCRRIKPGLHRRAFLLHSDHWHCRLAGHVHVHRSDPPDQELLTGSTPGSSAKIDASSSAVENWCR